MYHTENYNKYSFQSLFVGYVFVHIAENWFKSVGGSSTWLSNPVLNWFAFLMFLLAGQWGAASWNEASHFKTLLCLQFKTRPSSLSPSSLCWVSVAAQDREETGSQRFHSAACISDCCCSCRIGTLKEALEKSNVTEASQLPFPCRELLPWLGVFLAALACVMLTWQG